MPDPDVAEAAGEQSDGDDVDVTRPVLRLFAAARLAAGTGRAEMQGTTVGEVLDRAAAVYGAEFETVLAASRVWLNGEPTSSSAPVCGRDEIAVLPPVSGGA